MIETLLSQLWGIALPLGLAVQIIGIFGIPFVCKDNFDTCQGSSNGLPCRWKLCSLLNRKGCIFGIQTSDTSLTRWRIESTWHWPVRAMVYSLLAMQSSPQLHLTSHNCSFAILESYRAHLSSFCSSLVDQSFLRLPAFSTLLPCRLVKCNETKGKRMKKDEKGRKSSSKAQRCAKERTRSKCTLGKTWAWHDMARFMWTYKAKVVITPARLVIIWYSRDNWQDFNGFQTSVYTYNALG